MEEKVIAYVKKLNEKYAPAATAKPISGPAALNRTRQVLRVCGTLEAEAAAAFKEEAAQKEYLEMAGLKTTGMWRVLTPPFYRLSLIYQYDDTLRSTSILDADNPSRRGHV